MRKKKDSSQKEQEKEKISKIISEKGTFRPTKLILNDYSYSLKGNS